MNGEDDVLGCLCLNLRRGARRLTQVYDRALRGSGLKITQFQLIAAIERFGRTTLLPLADVMGMDRTTLTRNLAVLERDGLVLLEPGVEDRREQWVSLTVAGTKALEAAMPKWKAAQRRAVGTLGAADTGRLLKDLKKLTQKE